MTTPREHVVRDYLAGNLELLEPGLRLYKTEFRLPNSVGARGSIDIVARDQHGMWVIIEVKRAKKPSREAVTEVAKYVELLSRELHVKPDRIRVIIASSHWDELLAPVSFAAREWSVDVRGYLLAIENDGAVSGAERVILLDHPVERSVTPIHIIYFFGTAEGRDFWWSSIKARAAEVGAPDLLAAAFDRVDNLDNVIAHYGLYIGIGKTEPAMITKDIAGPYDGPEPFAQEFPAEYQTLCHITRYVHSGTTARSVLDIESAVPGDLYKIENDPDWKIIRYLGAGAFAKTNAYEQEDYRRFLSGDDLGQSQITFEGSANPRVKTRWATFCEQARGSLGGNADWEVLVPAWLESAAQFSGDIDVWLKIYNPCDFVQTIFFGWPDKILQHMPLVEGRVRLPAGGIILLGGELCWDGRTGINVPEHIAEVYHEPLNWFIARYAGETWFHDRKLLKRLGLRYILREILLEPVPGEPDALAPCEWTIWTVEDDRARCVTTKNPNEYSAVLTELNRDGRILSVDEYLAANAGQVQAAVQNYLSQISMPTF